MYLFISGCVGPSWLLGISSSCRKQGLLSSCGVWAAHCSGFSLQRTSSGACSFRRSGSQAPAQAQQLWCMGFAALRHVGSSWTGDRTHVSCVGRRILYRRAPREKPLREVLCPVTLGSPWRPACVPSISISISRAWRVRQSQLRLVSVSFSTSSSITDINCPRTRWGARLLVRNWTLCSLRELSMTVWAQAAFEDGELPVRGRPQAPVQGSYPSWIPQPPALRTTCHIKSISYQQRAQRIRTVTRMGEGGSGGKLSSAISRCLSGQSTIYP